MMVAEVVVIFCVYVHSFVGFWFSFSWMFNLILKMGFFRPDSRSASCAHHLGFFLFLFYVISSFFSFCHLLFISVCINSIFLLSSSSFLFSLCLSGSLTRSLVVWTVDNNITSVSVFVLFCFFFFCAHLFCCCCCCAMKGTDFYLFIECDTYMHTMIACL